MTNQLKLQQPVLKGSLRATNFFNGRLVTDTDMTREQDARREAVWRVGRAAGDGIVYGLEVEKGVSADGEPIVNVSQGLAVNRHGQTLSLSQDASVNLLQRFGTVDQPSTIFGACQTLQVGTYTTGYGLYLLVLSPVETSAGSAPTSGLNNAFAACNTDVILETVQFRLLAVAPFLTNERLPGSGLLRNYIAYRCFGAEEKRAFFENPLGFPLTPYGLIDEMREEKTLSGSDVPLAIINWTSGGLEFVEMWAVRRRLTTRNDDAVWTQLIDDRRMSESEAMMQQFADQIESLQIAERDLPKIEAEDYFRFLPPAGLLPIASSEAGEGFDLNGFFGPKGSQEIALLEGSRLRALLGEALAHEPIDMDTDEKIQLYFMRENLEAVEQGQNVRLALVFARHSLPYYGVARFGRAEWNLSRFAARVK
jgi:hypothetical protein